LPLRPAEALCFRTREVPGKEGIKAIPCRESHSKAYPSQESESDLVQGTVMLLQEPSVGWIHRRRSRVQDKMRSDEYGTKRHFHAPDSNVPPSNLQLWSLVMPGHSQTGADTAISRRA